MADYPRVIPLFPLPDFVLFPDVTVPLHIFEPRYRQMVHDASAGDGIIGMTMLKSNWERDYYAYPDVYEIGCAGRISALSRLSDGRYNLLLDSFGAFRIVRESRDHAYRTAEIEWLPSAMERLDEIDGLHRLLKEFIGASADTLWRSLVDERKLTGAALVNYICFHLDIAPLEKQTLLEAGASRVSCLADVLTFKLEERKLGLERRRGHGQVQ
ncbi:MAG TPA: LON peptidase substrate-binding domain-containing protein [Candidatus Binataceae bacterium]|nr:LON peptidase substrate-binding domain-containing protein [Candidatus Binataceae bacterium]